MKNYKLFLGIFLCIFLITANILISTDKSSNRLDINLINLQANANPEIDPLNEWTSNEYNCPPGSTLTQGRNCLRVANGSPNCYNILCY